MVRSSPRVTMVTRDQRGSRLSPTESVSMLNPRALNSPTIRDNSPGSSATIIESVCLNLADPEKPVNDDPSLDNHVARVRTRRHDRKHVLFFSDHDVHDCHTFLIDRSLQNTAKLGRFLCAKTCGAVCFSKFYEVRRDGNIDFGVSAVVEHLLPLAHHPEVTVVHDQNFDGQAILNCGRELLVCHLKSTDTDDRDYELLR